MSSLPERIASSGTPEMETEYGENLTKSAVILKNA